MEKVGCGSMDVQCPDISSTDDARFERIAAKPEAGQQQITAYSGKHRHRTVFAERCEPLSQVRSLRRVFAALHNITLGMLLYITLFH